MRGIYNFGEDLSLLKRNYESYEDKLKQALDNGQFSRNRNKDVPTIREDVNYSEPIIQDNSKIDLDGIISLTDDQLFAESDYNQDFKPTAETLIQNNQEHIKDLGYEYGTEDILRESGVKPSDVAKSNKMSKLTKGGTGFGNNIGGIVDFGFQTGNALSTVSGSESESIMSGLNLTAKGIQTGSAIGGPLGGAIGGAIGLGVGIFDYFGDMGKRNKAKRKAYNDNLERNETRREQEYRMKEGEESLTKLMNLRKNQLNYLDIKY